MRKQLSQCFVIVSDSGKSAQLACGKNQEISKLAFIEESPYDDASLP